MTVATILSIGSGMDVLDQEAASLAPGSFRPRYRSALSGQPQADSAHACLPAHRWSTNNIFNRRRREPVR